MSFQWVMTPQGERRDFELTRTDAISHLIEEYQANDIADDCEDELDALRQECIDGYLAEQLADDMAEEEKAIYETATKEKYEELQKLTDDELAELLSNDRQTVVITQ